MTHSAVFQFFLTLNDFLSVVDKYKPFRYNFKGSPAIKDAIEAIGIPHTEVDFIIVNGSPVNFSYKLTNNDTVDVYPANADTVFAKSYSLIPNLSCPITFVADVQVGRLARTLRMLGFDTLYKNDFSDKSVAEIAEKEQRIVLTRDVGLLKHKSIKWGYWLRSQTAEKQLQEVVNRFNLLPEVSLFKRCLLCNGEINRVEKASVLKELPPKTIQFFNDFFQCSRCNKIYWKGSHYEHMLEMIKRNFKID